MEYHASCCCGTIRFTIDGAPSMMGTCHCSRCRKLGAPTFVFVKAEQLRNLEGAAHIIRYLPTPPYQYTRSFCGTCGTALGELGAEAESFPLNANLFDTPLPLANHFHEFVAEKPEWLRICDDENGGAKLDHGSGGEVLLRAA